MRLFFATKISTGGRGSSSPAQVSRSFAHMPPRMAMGVCAHFRIAAGSGLALFCRSFAVSFGSSHCQMLK